jgi:hypothetical protein
LGRISFHQVNNKVFFFYFSSRIKALGTLPSPVSTAAFVVRAIGGNEVNRKRRKDILYY